MGCLCKIIPFFELSDNSLSSVARWRSAMLLTHQTSAVGACDPSAWRASSEKYARKQPTQMCLYSTQNKRETCMRFYRVIKIFRRSLRHFRVTAKCKQVQTCSFVMLKKSFGWNRKNPQTASLQQRHGDAIIYWNKLQLTLLSLQQHSMFYIYKKKKKGVGKKQRQDCFRAWRHCCLFFHDCNWNHFAKMILVLWEQRAAHTNKNTLTR